MGKKSVVAIVVAAAVSLAIPFSSIVPQSALAATPGPKAGQAKAKSRQAIAARQGSQRTPKKPVKRTTARKPAAKKQT